MRNSAPNEPRYSIITFPSFDTGNGTLSMIQEGSAPDGCTPFAVKKVLSITGMKDADKRGGHSHKTANNVLICTGGGCTVDLDDGRGKKTSVRLDKRNEGLFLYPNIWFVIHDFESGTSLLEVCDKTYDEEDYIRNYEDFIQHINQMAS